jgi:hypothetical protein
MPAPPYGAGNSLPPRSRATAPTIFQVPTIDAIPNLSFDHVAAGIRHCLLAPYTLASLLE